jgi:FlaA1/EpsC-like NDP-sugar epimerase
MRGTYNLVGLIDDNPNKKDFYISGVKIIGNRYKILETCKKNNIDVIFFSITKINSIEKREILNLCQETGAKLRILPSTEYLIKNKTVMQNLRDVEIDDIT